jgi:hypothetical protein
MQRKFLCFFTLCFFLAIVPASAQRSGPAGRALIDAGSGGGGGGGRTSGANAGGFSRAGGGGFGGGGRVQPVQRVTPPRNNMQQRQFNGQTRTQLEQTRRNQQNQDAFRRRTTGR